MIENDKQWLDEIFGPVYINQNAVEANVKDILSTNRVTQPENITRWLLRAVSLIDLTTLSGDDTRTNVLRLCVKAANPLSQKICEALHTNDLKTAAVCVYPSRVADASEILTLLGCIDSIKIASVAAGFPAGLYPLNTRLDEIRYAVKMGANEIDVVLDRSLVIAGKWETLHQEVAEMKKACGEAHLKVILGVGEVGSLANVYKASMVAMLAGANFIKTSTGKESVNATLPVGLVMCRAIRDYYQLTGDRVGLKPAGGIKTVTDVTNWLVLVYTQLGEEWLSPQLFRIGASSLLGAIEAHLHKYTSKGDSQNLIPINFNFI